MGASIKHAYTAGGTNDPSKEVSKDRWNAEHTIVQDAAGVLGAAAAGASGVLTGAQVRALMQPGGTTYWQHQAALLDPALVEAIQMDAFSYVVGSSETKYCLASWATRLGSAGRWEVRNPIKPAPLRGVTVTGTGTDSSGMFLDPAGVTYADPWQTYIDRLGQIATLKTRFAAITGASARTPLLPGPYGSILTGVTCFDLSWIAWRWGCNYGFNLWEEISDSNTQRVGNMAMLIPFNKRNGGEAEADDTGTGSGTVTWVNLPKGWGVADPLETAYGTPTFEDDFTGASLNTSIWTRTQSTAGNVEIDTNYQWCKLFGNTAWGNNGLFRTATESRVAGKKVVWDIEMPRSASGTGVAMVGWHDGAGVNFSDMVHGVNFAGGTSPGGIINLYENGTALGTVGAGWTPGGIYRVMVQLGTTGAVYKIQGGKEYPALGSASWTTLTPGTASSAATANVTPGAVAYASNAYVSHPRVFT